MAGGGRQPTALAPKEKHDDPYCHSVSVAAVIVRKEDDRVLAIRRRDNGAWQPPGGVLEPAEDIIEGLIREAAEEAGVIVRSPQLTGAYKHVGGPIVSLVFRCTIRRRVWDATRKTGGETVDVRWMTRAEIVEQMDRVFAPRVLDALDYVDRPAVRSHNGRSWRWAWHRVAARRRDPVMRTLIVLHHVHHHGSRMKRDAAFGVAPGLVLGLVLSIFMAL